MSACLHSLLHLLQPLVVLQAEGPSHGLHPAPGMDRRMPHEQAADAQQAPAAAPQVPHHHQNLLSLNSRSALLHHTSYNAEHSHD